MKWLRTTVPALVMAAQACSGGGSGAKDAGSSGVAGQPGGGANSAGGSASETAGSTSTGKGGSTPSGDSGAATSGAGGSTSTGKGGAASGGKGGSAPSGDGGTSSAGKGGSASAGAAGAGGAGPVSGGGNCVAGATDPCVRQALEWSAGDDNPKKGVLTFKQPLLAGSTVLVFAADMNTHMSAPDAPIGSGTPDPIVLTDSGTGTYKQLLTVLDQPDWDDIQVFARTNVPAGTLTPTATWITNQWHAMMILEVANVAASPSIKAVGTLNHKVEEKKDAASSGPVALGATPALVVGLGVNFTDKKGDVGAPAAGTGFTAVLPGWNWNGKEGTTMNNSALLVSAYYAKPGNVAVTFTPTMTINYLDNVMVIGVGIQ